MSEKIGITMVGAPGTGKSCFLYAMYSQMAMGVNGFTFTPTDYDKSLDLDKKWEEIAENGRWPKPTQSEDSLDYEFQCNYAFKPLITFTWHDYKGGLLNEKGETRRALFEKFRSSFALIFCISADLVTLAKAGDRESLAALIRYTRILTGCRADLNNPIPVVLTITQSDRFSSQKEFREAKDFLVKGPFAPLFAEGENWMVMITGVSLGDKLSKGPDDSIIGEINPVNIHYPVMFAVYIALLGIRANLKGKFRSLEGGLSQKENELFEEQTKSVIARIFNDRRGDIQSEKNKIEAALASMSAEIGRLEKDLNKILIEISTKDEDKPCAFVYFDGSEVMCG